MLVLTIWEAKSRYRRPRAAPRGTPSARAPTMGPIAAAAAVVPQVHTLGSLHDHGADPGLGRPGVEDVRAVQVVGLLPGGRASCVCHPVPLTRSSGNRG